MAKYYWIRKHYISGKVPSIKMDRMIYYGSSLERDTIYLLDYHIQVSKMKEYPLKLTMDLPGKKKPFIYSPSFLLNTTENKTILLDCLPSTLAESEIAADVFGQADNYCCQNGWDLQIMTEKTLYAAYFLENIMKLRRYAYDAIDPIYKSQIMRLVMKNPSMTLQVVQEQLSLQQNKSKAALMNMLYFHEIEADIKTQPISGTTRIFLRK